MARKHRVLRNKVLTRGVGHFSISKMYHRKRLLQLISEEDIVATIGEEMTMARKKRVSRNKLIPSNIFNYIYLVTTYEQSQSKD